MQEPLANNSGYLRILYGNVGTFRTLWFTIIGCFKSDPLSTIVIHDIPRETVPVTVAFLYAVRCSVFLIFMNFCSQQQNRTHSFLWVFSSWKFILCCNISIGQKRKWKAFILYAETNNILSCLGCQRNREVKTQEDRTDRREKEIQGNLVNAHQFDTQGSAFWVIYVGIFNLGKLKAK